jgi:endonuclease-3
MRSKADVKKILAILKKTYPEARCTLDYQTPLDLLVATILSAQCTDERVNRVTPALFKKYPTARRYAEAPPAALEADVRSTGFYRNKARSIKALGQALETEHGGRVPDSLEALVKLPGVGRKTANVVLGTAFGVPGVVVDTHVARICRRLELTENQDPVKIEFDLMAQLPQEAWVSFGHRMIAHGRALCKARKPDCPHCPLLALCPFGQAA